MEYSRIFPKKEAISTPHFFFSFVQNFQQIQKKEKKKDYCHKIWE